MRKGLKPYIAVWAVMLALFNLLAFIPIGQTGSEKYTASFWIGYTLITVMFICQLICAIAAFRADSAKKMFYNISLIQASYTGLTASFIVGGLCMIITPLPYWVGVIASAVILAVNAIAVIKAAAVINAVERIDTNVRTQTLFIKSLTIDADSLTLRARSEAVRAECKKVYEAVRYSDPMSDNALSSVEAQITVKFALLSSSVDEDDAEKTAVLANELVILIGDRNKKCKLLK